MTQPGGGAQDSPDITVPRILNQLNESLDHNPDGQFEQLQLAAILSGLPIGLTEKAKSVSDVRSEMNKCSVFTGKVLTNLQALLEIVDAPPELVKKLSSPKKDLVECQQKLAFANLIVKICQALGSKEFDSLKALTKPLLDPTNPSNIKTKAQLFKFLYERDHLKEDELEPLVVLMKDVGREDIVAKHIEPFKRAKNPLAQESGEPAVATEVAEMDVDSTHKRTLSATRPAQVPRTISDTGTNTQRLMVESHQESDYTAQDQAGPAIGIPPVTNPVTSVFERGTGAATTSHVSGKGEQSSFMTEATVAKHFQDHTDKSPEGDSAASAMDIVEPDGVVVTQEQPQRDNHQKSSEDSGIQDTKTVELSGHGEKRDPQQTTERQEPEKMTTIDSPPSRDESFGIPLMQQQIKHFQSESSPLLECQVDVRHPPSGSINTEPYEVYKRTFRKWKKCMHVSQFLCSLNCIAFTLLIVAFSVLLIDIHRNIHQLALLGFNNDTIVAMDMPLNPLSNPIEIQECLLSGDSYHGLDVFLLSEESFTRYKLFRNDSATSREFNQTRPSRETGSAEYLYLVKGSVINYTLQYSVDRLPDVGEKYVLYLFDDRQKYFNYLQGLDDSGSIAHKNLPFDTLSNSVQFYFNVDHSSYYFIAAKTPGNLHYRYSYNMQVAYFNHKSLFQDGFQQCVVSYSHSCSVNIPAYGFYYLLAYIHASADSDPLTTHICVDQNAIRNIVRIFLPLLSVTLLMVFVFSFIVHYVYCRVKESARALNQRMDCYDVCGCSKYSKFELNSYERI